MAYSHRLQLNAAGVIEKRTAQAVLLRCGFCSSRGFVALTCSNLHLQPHPRVPFNP